MTNTFSAIVNYVDFTTSLSQGSSGYDAFFKGIWRSGVSLKRLSDSARLD